MDAWRKVSEPLVKDWSKDVAAKGQDADAVLNELKAEIAKRGAAAM
jgi:hypothetical protein